MPPSVSAAAAVSVVTSAFLLYICPYTKVEESFTLHAIRDLLSYGWEAESVGKVSPTTHLDRNFQDTQADPS